MKNYGKTISPLCPSEHDEQKSLMTWAALAAPSMPGLGLLYAIPNGGQRNKIVASKLKAEGVKPGVPDIHLPAPRRGWHGLYIEMKRRQGGRVSPEQKWWHEQLRLQGHQVVVCKGFEAARAVIEEYLR